jgi:hypothetical protein
MHKKPPMPKDWGFRYIGWLLYTNALSIVMTVQLIFLQFTMDSTLSRPTVHWLLSGVNVLGIIIAQIKRATGPPPRPLKHRK